MHLVNKQSLQNAFRAAEVEDQTQDNAMIIIDEAMFNPHEKALTITGVMNQFDAETPSDKDISDVIYAVNILSFIIGYSMDDVPQTTLGEDAYMSATQQQRDAFLVTFRTLKDYLTKLKSTSDPLFTTEARSHALTSRVQNIFESLLKMSKVSPSAPQDYEK